MRHDEQDLSGLESVIPPKRPHIPPPQFVPGRGGTRLYSLNALIERVVAAFSAEHGDGSAALDEAVTTPKRLRLILETARYVLAVESVSVTDEEKAQIVERAYSDLFGYGPLDALFVNPQITTVSIKGVRSAAIRTGHGELTGIGQLFDDADHLRRVITRLLADAANRMAESLRASHDDLASRVRELALPANVNVTSYNRLALITGEVAELIVNTLEMINIHSNQQGRFASAGHSVEFSLQD